ncbi:MAG: hypothetical protein JKX68_09860, partial [Flavobacteriales bacterium]|nr:hypothetical protein [Flavobacteriales bacterium]
MRNEIQNIELIEKYLRDELSAADKKSFEDQLKTDANLQKEVELQKEVIKGIERIGVKQSIQKAYKKYKLGKSGFNLGLGTIILVAVVSAFLWYSDSNKANANSLPEFNEKGEKVWADADKYLESQKFTINTSKDTVIETEEGIVMYIPAGSFLDDNGNEVTGEVEYEVKEALNTAQILQGGLSSKSGERLLESAGMFYVNARKDGKTVQINPAKGIYTEVPADDVNPDMQLFEGKRMADGSIDWIDPKPLEKFLTPVNIHSLNFYPPKYEPKLGELGVDLSDKEYKDSLYYSFAYNNESPTEEEKITNEAEAIALVEEMFEALEEAMNDTTEGLFDTVESAVDSSSSDSELVPSVLSYNGINPAKIKTIWSDEFSNTLLATREFEERLKTIFGTCNDVVLDLYINNMNLNLYEIDEMAASMTYGESKAKFLEFASRKDGKVEIDDKRVQKLQKHYERKQKLIAEAVAKTKEKFDREHQKLDGKVQKERDEHNQAELERKSDNYVQEFNLNLRDAYRQLGMKKPKRLDAKGIYRLTLKRGGWKNVDAYVMESLNNRETLDYTDPITGKKAVIKYEPISVTVVDETKYDRVFVYILPDKLNSFMRMKKEGEKYAEKLNELMSNSVICLAYIGEQAYFYSDDDVAPKGYNIQLTKMPAAELKGKLNRYDKKQTSNLLKEFDYQFVEVKESKRQEFLTNR